MPQYAWRNQRRKLPTQPEIDPNPSSNRQWWLPMVRINDGMIKNPKSARTPVEMIEQNIDFGSIITLASIRMTWKTSQLEKKVWKQNNLIQFFKIEKNRETNYRDTISITYQHERQLQPFQIRVQVIWWNLSQTYHLDWSIRTAINRITWLRGPIHTNTEISWAEQPDKVVWCPSASATTSNKCATLNMT